MTLKQHKLATIREALIYYNHNRTHTAKALGISVRGLRNILKELSKEDLYPPKKTKKVSGGTIYGLRKWEYK